MSEDSVLTWERREQISTPISDGSFIMRINDWNRIKRNLLSIEDKFEWLQTVYSLFFGVFISTFLSTILVYYTEGIPSMIIVTYAVIAVFSLLLSIVCLYLERLTVKEKNTTLRVIINDMNDIEKIIPQLCPPERR